MGIGVLIFLNVAAIIYETPAMKFCELCGSYMTKHAGADGAINFECPHCANVVQGTAEDTLWFSGSTIASIGTNPLIIERACFDLAGKTVPFDCECGLPYISLVREQRTMQTIYVCKCGIVRDSTFAIIGRQYEDDRKNGV